MGVTATTRLPAGWYPDPEGGDHRRWWDGQEWTEYTAAFQRPTSVEDLDIRPADPSTVKKSGKARTPRAPRAPRRLRRVETAEETAVSGEATAPVRSVAVRLGRWVAGAVHARPSFKKHRRAHRSSR